MCRESVFNSGLSDIQIILSIGLYCFDSDKAMSRLKFQLPDLIVE